MLCVDQKRLLQPLFFGLVPRTSDEEHQLGQRQQTFQAESPTDEMQLGRKSQYGRKWGSACVFQQVVRKAKRKFFWGLNTVNSKSFWKVAKYMTKKNSSIPSLKDGGIAVESSDLDKAALLNHYFSKCFNQSVPPLKTSWNLAALTLFYALRNSYALSTRFLKCYLPLTSRKQTVGTESQLECWDQLQEALLMELHCCLINPSQQGKYPKLGKRPQ